MTHVFQDKQQTSWWSAGDTQQDGGSLHLHNRRRAAMTAYWSHDSSPKKRPYRWQLQNRKREIRSNMGTGSNVGAAGTRKVPLRNSFSSWLLCESPRPATSPKRLSFRSRTKVLLHGFPAHSSPHCPRWFLVVLWSLYRQSKLTTTSADRRRPLDVIPDRI